ncbi:MAG: YceI family protein [Myxococcales bacterium]|nr:YceI family protein [Myxococcales bacterium]MCB9734055.1 YceI family protein [Deltaproteobacteria bacterium]
MTDATPATATPSRRPLRYLPAGAALVAAGLTLVRYLVQGSGNVYTDVARTFYVKDELIGWSATRETWLWVGLEVIGLIVGLAFACVVGQLLAGKLRKSPPARGSWGERAAVIIVAGNVFLSVLGVATLAVPIAAFASGLPPAGAEAVLPDTAIAGPDPTSTAVRGGDPRQPTLEGAAAGTYRVVEGAEANLVVVQIAAGGETFDARFAPVTGTATLDPAELEATSAHLSVPSASIDTGIALRSQHAKEDLLTEANPAITVDIPRLDATAAAGSGEITFATKATVGLMGDSLALDAQGSVKVLAEAERKKLGLTASQALLVNAKVEIPLARTKLDPSDFDQPTVRVTARFVLQLDEKGGEP